MSYFVALSLFFHALGLVGSLSDGDPEKVDQNDYITYHRTIAEAQKLIANKDYQHALDVYKRVFDRYDFIFSKDYRVATQLALQTGDDKGAFTYLRKAMATGWRMKEIKKFKFLDRLQRNPEWKVIERQYDSLQTASLKNVDGKLRGEVKKLFGKDQRRAFLALFVFSSKKREHYAEQKFAPHSEQQMAQLAEIIKTAGYPGEKLIGNGYWASVIISHHNSISTAYNRKDTLYRAIRPELLTSLKSGRISPNEFARIDDWYVASKSNRQEKRFEHLASSLSRSDVEKVDSSRNEIGMSSVETLNSLLDLQSQTGMNFFIPSDMRHKITIKD